MCFSHIMEVPFKMMTAVKEEKRKGGRKRNTDPQFFIQNPENQNAWLRLASKTDSGDQKPYYC